MKNIVIIGSSGWAKNVIDVIEKEGKYKIMGLIDPYRKIGEATLGYEVLGKETDLPTLYEKYNLHGVFVAIGDNYIRTIVVEKLHSILTEVEFISAIHPNAILGKDVVVGSGTVLMAGVVVDSCSQIGSFCILNTNSSLGHDSIMHDFSSLAPNAATGGSCVLGGCSAISIGATVIHGVSVGEHTIIGAGSVVISDVNSYYLAYGLPAREVRKRKAGEKYL